jgi:hypothetical protein
VIAAIREMPTNEKTATGGNQEIDPQLPSTNNKAAKVIPAIKHVPNFNSNESLLIIAVSIA